jgi:hypothetical protein
MTKYKFRDLRKFDIIFKGNGLAIFQTKEFCHTYTNMCDFADDLKKFFKTGSTEDLSINEPESRKNCFDNNLDCVWYDQVDFDNIKMNQTRWKNIEGFKKAYFKNHKSVSLEMQTDDFGKQSLYKIEWNDESYCITKLEDGRFQASYYGEFIGNHDTIEGAIQDIEDHIEGNQ